MRWYRRSIGPLAVAMSLGLAPFASAQPAAKNAPARPPENNVKAAPIDPARLERLLQVWEQRSTQLKTLDVNLKRTDTSKVFGDTEEYEGRVMLQSPNLAFVEFRKVETVQDKRVAKVDERIVCTGDEVWQYKVDTRQIFIFPLDKKDQNKALEEGPLPFLFNMKAADAKRRYQMTLSQEDEKSYVINIVPRLDIDQQAFSLAIVQLNKKYFLPTRILLVSPDRKSTKDFEMPLTGMKANQPIAAANFQGVVPPKWKVVRNPAGEPAREAPQAGAAVRQPGMQRGAAGRPPRR